MCVCVCAHECVMCVCECVMCVCARECVMCVCECVMCVRARVCDVSVWFCMYVYVCAPHTYRKVTRKNVCFAEIPISYPNIGISVVCGQT